MIVSFDFITYYAIFMSSQEENPEYFGDFGDGGAFRDYIYNTDVVELI